jgi:hypothetical protein
MRNEIVKERRMRKIGGGEERSRFEGMVLARLEGIDERIEELLRQVGEIGRRCMTEHASVATLRADLKSVREKSNFNAKVIWGAVAWIVVSALGALAAMLR